MATYGPGTPGSVPFTGYTNTLAAGSANTAGTSGSVYFNGVQQGDDRIAKMLRNGGMTGALSQILLTILGAAPGTTATKNKVQVQWQQGSPGGAIPIETIPLVNRATTAADVTMFQALVNRVVFPSTYPPDLSRNGGGGKITW